MILRVRAADRAALSFRMLDMRIPVCAEPVEASSFLSIARKKGRPFDSLRANGEYGSKPS
jgi:hypothetical protein